MLEEKRERFEKIKIGRWEKVLVEEREDIMHVLNRVENSVAALRYTFDHKDTPEYIDKRLKELKENIRNLERTLDGKNKRMNNKVRRVMQPDGTEIPQDALDVLEEQDMSNTWAKFAPTFFEMLNRFVALLTIVARKTEKEISVDLRIIISEISSMMRDLTELIPVSEEEIARVAGNMRSKV